MKKRRNRTLLSTVIAFTLLFGVRSRCMAQSDMTGYWKFSVPNGGLSYMEIKQTGEAVSTVGRRPMTGTLHGGKLHLQSGNDPNATVIEAIVKGEKSPARRTTHDGQWGGVELGFLERVTKEEVHPARLALPDLPVIVRADREDIDRWSGQHGIGDVETEGGNAILMETYGFAVQIDFASHADAFELEEDALPFGVGGDAKVFAVPGDPGGHIVDADLVG